MPEDSGHPNPDRQRGKESWLSLNGEWEFAFDDTDVGVREQWFGSSGLANPSVRKIKVPYAFQTSKSGINDQDHHELMWYKLDIAQKIAKLAPGDHETVLLHFEQVDYECNIYLNGQFVTHHVGGQSAFMVDLTPALSSMENDAVLTVRVKDSYDPAQPRGKQYWRKPAGIMYTPSSGIIGSVWLEKVPLDRLMASTLILKPDFDAGNMRVSCDINKTQGSYLAELTVSLEGSFISSVTVPVVHGRFSAVLPMGNYSAAPSAKLEEIIYRHTGEGDIIEANDALYQGFGTWSPECPILYDVSIKLKDEKEGKVIDELCTYAGMRKVEWEDGVFKLNGKPYFQRLVLDQGYWPDTGITAPSGEALKRDIELSKELGFNGARKHQKIEDQRYHYWADKLGFLVWSELGNAWLFNEKYVESFAQEWVTNVKRSMSHPSVVAWVPVNESWGVPTLDYDARQRHHLLSLYHTTKSLDTSRPVIVNDGWQSVTASDLWGLHDYRSAQLADTWSSIPKLTYGIQTDGNRKAWVKGEKGYKGQPIICTEFGGFAVQVEKGGKDWGYAKAENPDALIENVRNAVRDLLSGGLVQGFCYTQIADCEQEINGLLTPDRRFKADVNALRDAIRQPQVHKP